MLIAYTAEAIRTVMTVMWNAERSGAVPVTFHPRSTPVIGQIPGTERGSAFPRSTPVPPRFHPRGTHPFFYSDVVQKYLTLQNLYLFNCVYLNTH